MLERLRRRRGALTVATSIIASLMLGFILATKWDELETGVTGAPLAIAAAAVSLQLLALLARSEAWHVCVRAGGGRMSRRTLYRASSMGFVGGLLHTQLGTAARIAALRRSAPAESPRVPALICAELPILIVEGSLAAITSFTLVGPLGLPWWVPLLCLAAIAGVSAALRTVGAAGVRWVRSGLSVMRSLDGSARLVGFVLIAVFAQVTRNWLLLHAVGVDASLFDAVAVLIAVVTLGQLPFGLSVGAAASVLILGTEGMAGATAAGVLLTATGTVGGLLFAAWGALDFALSGSRMQVLERGLRSAAAHLSAVVPPAPAVSALFADVRRAAERTCFDLIGHLQVGPMLVPASGPGLGPAPLSVAVPGGAPDAFAVRKHTSGQSRQRASAVRLGRAPD
jgi:hypothetical protein